MKYIGLAAMSALFLFSKLINFSYIRSVELSNNRVLKERQILEPSLDAKE